MPVELCVDEGIREMGTHIRWDAAATICGLSCASAAFGTLEQ